MEQPLQGPTASNHFHSLASLVQDPNSQEIVLDLAKSE